MRVLKLRARLALGQYDAVAAEAAAEPGVPDLQAAGALAAYLQSGDDKAVATAQKLAAEQGDNLSVQLLAGSVLANAGLTEEALALLAKHQGSLDAYVSPRLRLCVGHGVLTGVAGLR